jgi:hypothetical protein
MDAKTKRKIIALAKIGYEDQQDEERLFHFHEGLSFLEKDLVMLDLEADDDEYEINAFNPMCTLKEDGTLVSYPEGKFLCVLLGEENRREERTFAILRRDYLDKCIKILER